ncbi:MAG: Branched-chain-amino-acid aminotransferase [Nitrosomonadaceae bacterium]|nr:Branched-chain-amino-acid aminotransferase [Nitrosomonadaceae bacterium]
MLDSRGFVASCNSTNFFIVRKGCLWTSTGTLCFPGITRTTIIELARDDGIPVREGDYTLAETYNADEAFVSGTLAGITPVSVIDGRKIPMNEDAPVTQRLLQIYQDYIIAK